MRLLLDSHAVYWWVTGNDRLSGTAKETILDSANAVFVSSVSIYEIELKAGRRRLNLQPQVLRSALKRNDVEEVAITHSHAEYAAHLEWKHRDPWDRLLAAQAVLENCVLVSVDKVFDSIAIDRHW